MDCYNGELSFICSGFITGCQCKKATKKIEQALEKKDPISLAQGYESLADNYQSLNDFSKAVEFNQRQADLYVSQNNFDKAIETKKKVLKEDFVQQNAQKYLQPIKKYF